MVPAHDTKTHGDPKLSRKLRVTIPRIERKFLKIEAGDLILSVKEDENVLIEKGERRIKEELLTARGSYMRGELGPPIARAGRTNL